MFYLLTHVPLRSNNDLRLDSCLGLLQVGVGSGRSRESSPLTMLDPMAPRSGASGGSPVAVALLARNSGIGSGGGSGSNSAWAGGAGGGVVGSRVRSSSASGSNSNSPGYLSAEHSDDSDVIGDNMDERSIVVSMFIRQLR